MADTVWVHNQFGVMGELIADSIQAVGGWIEMDDSVQINGNLYMTGGISDGSSTGLINQVIKSDGAGHYFWDDASVYWELLVTDDIGTDADTLLRPVGDWGLSRQGNTQHGNQDRTHTNLGFASTTGEAGENWQYATVGGGHNNTAGNSYATVAGGQDNEALGLRSFIGGGFSNSATNEYSAIAGGNDNTVMGDNAFIGAGYQNVAGDHATVAGGYQNQATGQYSFVGGGSNNVAAFSRSSVIGGRDNLASGFYSSITGGRENATYGNYSMVAGGTNNTAWGTNSAIVGGSYLAVGENSFGFRGAVDGPHGGVLDLSTEDQTFHIADAHLHFNAGNANADVVFDGTTDSLLVIDGDGDLVYLKNSDLRLDGGLHDGASFGTPGDILKSDGANVYWDSPASFNIIEVDSIYSASADPADTIIVAAQMKIDGELIADSIQAVGGWIEMDDSVEIHGDLLVENKAYSTSTVPGDLATTMITKDYADARFANDDLSDNILDDLSNVDETGVADQRILRYNGVSGNWEVATLAVNDLDNADESGAINGSILKYDGSDWVVGTDEFEDADSDPTNEHISAFVWDDPTDVLTVAQPGNIMTVTIDNEADDITDDPIESLSNVTAGGALNDVLIHDGTNWVPGDVNTIVTETDPIFTAMDTEAELETHLTDVADVFTDNDGALTDDDLSDNNVGDLLNVDETGAADGRVLKYDGVSSTWITAADEVDDADAVVGNEYNTGFVWNDAANELQITDGGGGMSVTINNEADDITDDVIGDLSDVDLTGLAPDEFLQFDGTDWVPVDVNTAVVEADPIFGAMDTEAELETHLTDVGDVFTDNDGALTDDDITDDNIGDLFDVDVTGAVLNSVLKYNSITSTWEIGADNVDDADAVVGNEYVTAFNWDDGTNQLTITDGGGATAVTIDNEADDITDDVIGDLSDVDLTGLAATEFLQFDGANWVPVDVNTAVTETDPVFSAMDTEAELEAQLTDAANVYTDNDGALTDDDLSDNDLTDIGNVNTAGIADGQILAWDALGGEWVVDDNLGTDDQTLAEVLLSGNSAGATEIDMNSNKIVNLADGTVAGDALAYGQAAGGDLAGTYPSPTIAAGAVSDDEIDYTTVTLADFTDDVGYAVESELSDGNNATAPVGWDDLTGIPAGFADGTDDDDLSDNTVSDLSDVDDAGAVDGNILVYNAGTWEDAAHIVGNISDVDLTGLADNSILKYDAIGGTWDVSIDEVDDADADPTNEHNTAMTWTPATNQLALTDLGGTFTVTIDEEADDLTDNDLDELNDVTLTGIAANEILQWDGTEWVNVDPNAAVTETDPVFTAMDTEAELEAQLTDVGDVFTDNDGALTDDDLTDDPLNTLSDVDVAGALNGAVLKFDGANWIDGTDLVDDADAVLGNEYNTNLNWNDVTDELSIVDPGATFTVTIDNEADDLTDNDLDELSDVTLTGIAADEILQWNGTAWVNVDANSTITETDPVFGAMDTEGELETQLLGLDVFTANDGALTDDDLTDDPLNTLSDVDVAGALNGAVLKFDGTNWIDGTDLVDDADAVLGNEYNTALNWNDVTNVLQIVDPGATHSVTIDNEADDLTDNDLDELADVTLTGIAPDEILQWNGTAWVNVDANSTITETDPVFGAMDTEGELETQLGGLDVFTANDGALADDDITDDAIGSLVDVNVAGAVNGSVLKYDGSDWIVGTDAVNDLDSDPLNERNLALTYNAGTTMLTLTDAGGNVSTSFDIAADDLSDNSVNDLTDVDGSGATNGQVLKWDGTEWIPGDDNTLGVETDPEFTAVDTEAELEAHLTDVSDIYTDNDGNLNDDDLTNNILSDIGDVNVTGIVDQQVLAWNAGASEWQPVDNFGADDQDDTEIFLTDLVDFNYITGPDLHQGLDQLDNKINNNDFRIGTSETDIANLEDAVDDLDDGNPLTTPVTWDDLSLVPAGFADGIDNVDDADASTTNETITSVNFNTGTNILTITEAGTPYTADLSTLAGGGAGTDDQLLNLAGLDLSIEDGNTVSFTGWDNDASDDVNTGDNVSVLVNDANYIATGDNVSALTNDAGYITSADDADADPTNEIQDLFNTITDGVNTYTVASATDDIEFTASGAATVSVDPVTGIINIYAPNASDSVTAVLDTIRGSNVDTVVVMNDFKVYGELIADSIQAVGDLLYLDDNTEVDGYISRPNNNLYGTNAGTHINLGRYSITGTTGFNYSYATVGGGYYNNAEADYTVVSGGQDNTASSGWATVGGGWTNDASGEYSTIAGGYDNTASSANAVIAGGRENIASGLNSSVIGGQNNTASNEYAAICGGLDNTASGEYALVIGGDNNTASGFYSVVTGGTNNSSTMNYSTVGGGFNNTASGLYSSIPGGRYLQVGNGSFGFRGGLSNPFSTLNVAAETNTFHIANAGFHFNHTQEAAADFRLESDTKDDMFFMDAGTERVGIGTDTPASTHQIEGSKGWAVAAVSSTGNLDETHNVVLASNTITLTLPAAAGVAGRVYTIKNVGTGVITVAGNGGENIDGAGSLNLAAQYDYVEIVSDGTQWYVIGQN